MRRTYTAPKVPKSLRTGPSTVGVTSLPTDNPISDSQRQVAETLRNIEQPQRALAKWLREQLLAGSVNPGGRIVALKGEGG